MRKRLTHLWPALAASAVALLVCTVVAAIVVGPVGVAGAALGIALVVASYTVTSVVLAWLDKVNRPMILPVGLVTYALKFSAFGVFLYVMQGMGWDGTPAMAASMALGVVVWVTTQAVWVYRSRIPYVDLTES